MRTGSLTLYGLILAAGYSSRMGGEPKALVELGPGAMLEMAARALQSGGANPIAVVTGHREAEVARAARKLGIVPVTNPNFAQGMFSSLCAGFACLLEIWKTQGKPPAAVLLLPVDAPLAEAWTVAAIAGYWRSLAGEYPADAETAVIIPGFNGRSGHPPLIGIRHLETMLPQQEQLAENGGLRAYLGSLLRPAALSFFQQGLLPEADEADSPCLEADSAFSPHGAFEALPPCPVVHAGKPGQSVTFLPLPDAGIISDLDRPENCAQAREFLALTRNRSRPSPEEAWEWLRYAGLGEKKIRHSILVALGALRLGQAMEAAAMPIDLDLHGCGALLHDIVRKCSLKDKKCKAHGRRAQDMLTARGWRDCALVVGAHTVLPDSMLAALGVDARDVPVACSMTPRCAGADRDEKIFRCAPECSDPHAGASPELLHACAAVYLADKYFFMDRYVSLEERFGMVMERFFDDAEAVRAISHRLNVARLVRNWFLSATGVEPERLLRGIPDHAFSAPGPAKAASTVWQPFLLRLLKDSGS